MEWQNDVYVVLWIDVTTFVYVDVVHIYPVYISDTYYTLYLSQNIELYKVNNMSTNDIKALIVIERELFFIEIFNANTVFLLIHYSRTHRRSWRERRCMRRILFLLWTLLILSLVSIQWYTSPLLYSNVNYDDEITKAMMVVQLLWY